jgi:hypothetical protein
VLERLGDFGLGQRMRPEVHPSLPEFAPKFGEQVLNGPANDRSAFDFLHAAVDLGGPFLGERLVVQTVDKEVRQGGAFGRR